MSVGDDTLNRWRWVLSLIPSARLIRERLDALPGTIAFHAFDRLGREGKEEIGGKGSDG